MTVKELKEQLDKYADNIYVKVETEDGKLKHIVDAKYTFIEEEVYPPQMFIDTRRMEFVGLRLEQ